MREGDSLSLDLYGLSYDWEYSPDGESWQNWYEGGTISCVPFDCNGYYYRCRIADEDGRYVYSRPICLCVEMDPETLRITQQPESITALEAGTVFFRVSANGSGLTYQ